MRRSLFLMFVFFLLSNYIFSQTWTERDDNWEYEVKVLTKDEWNRLLKQKESEYKYANLYFDDVLEDDFKKDRTRKVIKGTKPTLRGYYYLLVFMTPRSKDAKIAYDTIELRIALVYGNDRTGEMRIYFLNSSGYLFNNSYLIGSGSYKQRYKQCIGWVNGN
jgi:hypothetical protein